MSIPRSVAEEILARQEEGSEMMNEMFGAVHFKKRGAEVEVFAPLDRAAFTLVYFAELEGTPGRAAGQMVKVARRWEDEAGKPGLHTSTYIEDGDWEDLQPITIAKRLTEWMG